MNGSEARIGQPNIMICKTVMHIVDAVLLPAPIAELAAGKVGYTVSRSAWSAVATHSRTDHKRCTSSALIIADVGWV